MVPPLSYFEEGLACARAEEVGESEYVPVILIALLLALRHGCLPSSGPGMEWECR